MVNILNIRRAKDREINAYSQRTRSDGGTIKQPNTISEFIQFLKFKGMYDKLELGIMADGGLKERASAPDNFASKVYSFGKVANDLTQTTSTQQPFIGGQIVTSERLSLKNPNSGTNYMTHPTISFAANESWAVSTAMVWNGDNEANNNGCLYAGYYPEGSKYNLFLSVVNNGIMAITMGDSQYTSVGGDVTKSNISKATLYTFVYANGIITCYKNGSIIGSVSKNSDMVFNSLIAGRSSALLKGSILAHYIWRMAPTPDQIYSLHSWLKGRNYLGDDGIPSIRIGEQFWATSNYDAVATPMGNIIPMVTADATWATAATLYTNAYNAQAGTVEQKTYAGVKAASMWCYYNNDPALGNRYGKLYNWYAVKLLQMDIDYYNAANPSDLWKWRVPTQADFNTLATTLGGASVAGGKMKVTGTTYWAAPNTGATNESQFSALGGGVRLDTTGAFTVIKDIGDMWTSTEAGATESYRARLDLSNVILDITSLSKIRGNSLRLIKS